MDDKKGESEQANVAEGSQAETQPDASQQAATSLVTGTRLHFLHVVLHAHASTCGSLCQHTCMVALSDTDFHPVQFSSRTRAGSAPTHHSNTLCLQSEKFGQQLSHTSALQL